MQDVLSESVDRKKRLELIAPLDPFLWDKSLIAALWDFHYSWEIYTPADHPSRTLQVKNIWFEPGVRETKEMQASIDRALTRFARFNDCEKVERKQ